MNTLINSSVNLWFKSRANNSAQEQGMSVNDIADEIVAARVEEELKQALLSARGMHLQAPVVTGKVYEAVRYQSIQRGMGIPWRGEYMRKFISELSSVWGLSQKTKEALGRTFVKTPRL